MRYATVFVVIAGAAALAFSWRRAWRHAANRRAGETAVSQTWLFRQQRSDDQ
jgi:hypothetical protein